MLEASHLAVSFDAQSEMRKKASEDDKYLENVLLEVKRLWPPFLGGRRVARKVTHAFIQDWLHVVIS